MIARKPQPAKPAKRRPTAFSQEIELRGHIIDSLTLPRVLDEILLHGGDFRMVEVDLGRTRTDPTYARIEVSGPSPEMVDDLVRRLRPHGAEIVDEGDAELAPAQQTGFSRKTFTSPPTSKPTSGSMANGWRFCRPPWTAPSRCNRSPRRRPRLNFIR